MGVFEKSQLRFSHTVKFLFQILKLKIVDMLLLNHLVFEILIFVFEQSVGIFVIMFDLLIFGKNAFDFQVFRVDHFLELGILVVKGLNLVQVLLLEILDFRMEIVIEL
jgi:hypothetical protein